MTTNLPLSDVPTNSTTPADIASEIETSGIELSAVVIDSPQDVVLTEPELSVLAELNCESELDTDEKIVAHDAPIINGFENLCLLPEVVEAVVSSGYTQPTAIQAEIIPHMLAGRDILAQSQTGTGKTAAFALPILSQLDKSAKQPQVLVLTPTRELAIQVTKAFETYGKNLSRFSALAIYGGQDYEVQFRALKRGVQVVVGTPGRVIDHVNRGTLDLSKIKTLVLDEADEMLNMGFLEDVQFVLTHAPDDRRIALFSATLPEPIRDIAAKYLNKPAKVTIKKKTMTAELIRQRAILVEPRDRLDVLTRVLESETIDGVIVFMKTREATVQVAESLLKNGYKAVALNGDMPQRQRERTIEQLKNGRLDILVATDVAARGLDVSRISHVINYDLPHDGESYVHRIGRTGRAGRKGEALIFLPKRQRHKLKLIEKVTRSEIEVIPAPSYKDVNAARVRRFDEKILSSVAQDDLTFFQELVERLASQGELSMTQIAAALARMVQGDREFYITKQSFRGEESSQTESNRRERGGDRGGERGSDRKPRARFSDGDGFDNNRKGKPAKSFNLHSPPAAGMERFRIEVGRADGVRPGNIVGAVANEAGIDGGEIGPIKIHDAFSTIDLPAGMPDEICSALQNTWVAGKQLQIRPWEDRVEDAAGMRRRPFKKRFSASDKKTGKPKRSFKPKFRK